MDHKKIRLVSQGKMRTYFQGLADDPQFLAKVRRLRKEHGIKPVQAIVITGVQTADWNPEYWKLVEKLEDNKKFEADLDVLCEEYGATFLWKTTLKTYVLGNEWMLDPFPMEITTIDLKDSLLKKFDESSFKFYGAMADMMPVAIQFSPYLSERDLINYIKLMYKDKIEPTQKRYQKEGVKIGKYRTRSSKVRERNEFIYKHCHLPKKDIVSMVKERFGGEVMDYTYINKIISEEKKKRK